MTTISVAYFTSPCASFAKIGRTANAGVAACTINFSLIKTITTTLDTEVKNAATLSPPNLISLSLLN